MKSSYLWTFGPHLQWENRIRTAHSFLARKKCFNAQITYCLLILGCQSHKSVKQLDFLRQKLKRCSNENILETIILAWWAAHMVALLIIHGNIAARYCRNNDKSILRDPTIHDRVEHFGYSKKIMVFPFLAIQHRLGNTESDTCFHLGCVRSSAFIIQGNPRWNQVFYRLL